MSWTETARVQYARAGLRYQSDTYDAEWAVIAALSSRPQAAGAAARGRSARCRRCDFIYRPHRLPVAFSAEGFSAVLHGAAVFPPLARRRDVGGHQPRVGDAGARNGRARGQSDGGDHRQPIGENHGKRGAERL